MKRLTLSLFLVLLVWASSAQSLLWKVSGKDLKKPSYLYGTIHIQDDRVFAFDSTVWHAFNACETFAMEVLLDQLDLKDAREKMLMEDGQFLSKMLSKEDYEILDSLCKAKLGVGAMFFNKMKPFFLSSTLQQVDMPQEQEQALDLFFLKTAREQNKTCFGLEEYIDQINAIDALKIEDQMKMLTEMLHDTANTSASEYDSLLQAYLAFDYAKMADMSDDPSLPKEFSKILIEKRNVKMYKEFRKIAKKQSVFCAVGAMHLGSDKSVVSLLCKKGYTVEPVPFKWKENDLK